METEAKAPAMKAEGAPAKKAASAPRGKAKVPPALKVVPGSRSVTEIVFPSALSTGADAATRRGAPFSSFAVTATDAPSATIV